MSINSTPETRSHLKRTRKDEHTKSKRAGLWDCDQDLLLIDSVQCRPTLYNKDVLSNEVRQAIWNEIGENLGASGESNLGKQLMK